MWALGVCLYRVVAGNYPFKGINESDLFNRIKGCHYSCPKFFSRELKEVLSKMLAKDPEKRITASQALQEPFFLKGSQDGDSDDSPHHRDLEGSGELEASTSCTGETEPK